jgi:hypothetical protein
MKTILLFSSLSISALSVNAQIQINMVDMPTAGGNYVSAKDTTVTSFGNAGASQTWDFASWTNQGIDTASFYAPSFLPGFSFFPTATMVTGDSSGSNFMKTSTSSVDILGFFTDFGMGPMPIIFSPAEKFLTLPSTYQTSFNGTSRYEVNFYVGQQGIDSIKIKAYKIYSSIIDGWGTITTPSNSNLNSLRQKINEIFIDSTYTKLTGSSSWIFTPSTPSSTNPSVDTSNTYRWWSNTKSFPVAEISTDVNNIVTDASYLLSDLTGISEKSLVKNDGNVFPNPASDKINFTGISEESFILIFDGNGKLVEKSRLQKNNVSLNTSNYENGIYFYEIIALNGNKVGKGKFVVSKP